jgi:MFS family permease
MSIYMLGAPLGLVIGYLLAGWLSEYYGWRMTFVLLGLPGVALALLAALLLKEPRRQYGGASAAQSSGAATAVTQPSLKEVYRTLWAMSTFRHLLLYFSLASFFSFGISKWQPAFFVRSHGLTTGKLGTLFAVVLGTSGLFGTYWGGRLVARYAACDEALQLKVMAAAIAAAGPISACIYLSPNPYWAFAAVGLAGLIIATTYGPLFAMIQTLVPPRMRALSIATIYLFANLIGMGLGPLAVGALSDALRPALGEESLRYALLAMCPGYVWGAWHLWLGSRTVKRDLPQHHQAHVPC